MTDRAYDDAIAYSRRWLDIIHQETLTTAEAQAIITETRTNFAKHFNAGFLEYRKSVTEAGDWTAVEWTGRGATFYDAMGREYIDCLGGYGLLSLGWSHPKVVEELIPGTLPPGVVLRVLRNLLKEKVSIKNILTILETLADFGTMTKDPDILTEYVRQALMRTISTPYIQNNTISVLALDPTLDGLISGSIQHTEHGSYLALDPEKSQKILMTLNKEVHSVGKQGFIPILLTSPISRAYMKRLCERYMPNLVVLSHNEIPPDVTIKNMGMVRIDAN